MTDRARELLEQIVAWWDDDKEFIGDFVDEIRAYLAEPEVKREPLHLNDVVKAFNDSEACGIMDNFIAGVLFAEKHHGIVNADV